MKAVRLHAYKEPPTVDDVAEPEITGPLDVIVRVGGAGLCRTDLHIRDGWFAGVVPVDLPLTLGHETAGWVHAVGSAVEHVAVGDTVICHPNISCGLCKACQAGQTMRCVKGLNFPGLTRDGGFAALLKTSARAVLPLDPRVEPADVAALADAGLAAYHAVRKAAAVLEPGSRVAVIGVGGLGHIGIQCLGALTPAEIIAVDRNPEALKLAEQCGAHHRVQADGQHVERVRQLTGGAALRWCSTSSARGPPSKMRSACSPPAATTTWSATAGRCRSRPCSWSSVSWRSSATPSAPPTTWRRCSGWPRLGSSLCAPPPTRWRRSATRSPTWSRVGCAAGRS